MSKRKILLCCSRLLGQMAWDIFTRRGLDIVAVTSPLPCVDHLRWWQTNVVADCAQGLIPWFPCDKRNEDALFRLWDETDANLLISVQYPWVLSDDFLFSIGKRAVNVHNAPLPTYGGFNGVVHAILNEEEYYGVTIHWMTRIADWGPVVFERLFGIKNTCTAIGLYKAALSEARQALHDLCDALLRGDELPRKEMEGSPNFYPRTLLDGLREIERPWEIEKFARAFWFPPYEPTFIRLGKRKVHFKYESGVQVIPLDEDRWL